MLNVGLTFRRQQDPYCQKGVPSTVLKTSNEQINILQTNSLSEKKKTRTQSDYSWIPAIEPTCRSRYFTTEHKLSSPQSENSSQLGSHITTARRKPPYETTIHLAKRQPTRSLPKHWPKIIETNTKKQIPGAPRPRAPPTPGLAFFLSRSSKVRWTKGRAPPHFVCVRVYSSAGRRSMCKCRLDI